jgi:hypothetical protein
LTAVQRAGGCGCWASGTTPTLSDRENRDFLVAAHALALEQKGEKRQGTQVLAAILPRADGEMTLIHLWLPDLVRLAMTTGDRLTARTATRASEAEAAMETQPARAAAASMQSASTARRLRLGRAHADRDEDRHSGRQG